MDCTTMMCSFDIACFACLSAANICHRWICGRYFWYTHRSGWCSCGCDIYLSVCTSADVSVAHTSFVSERVLHSLTMWSWGTHVSQCPTLLQCSMCQILLVIISHTHFYRHTTYFYCWYTCIWVDGIFYTCRPTSEYRTFCNHVMPLFILLV